MPESLKRKLGDELNMQLHLGGRMFLECFSVSQALKYCHLEEWLLHMVYSILTLQPGG